MRAVPSASVVVPIRNVIVAACGPIHINALTISVDFSNLSRSFIPSYVASGN